MVRVVVCCVRSRVFVWCGVGQGALDAQAESLGEREVALDRQERRAAEHALEAEEQAKELARALCQAYLSPYLPTSMRR